MLLRLRVLLATQFLLPLAFGLAGNAHAQAVPGQGTWQDTLLGRDINLHAVAATDTSAVYLYDKTLKVTWLRDANANAGNGNGGLMDWNTAMAWASNLATGSGSTAISDWRLPAMADPAAALTCSYSGPNCGYNVATSSSEMASMLYSTLGNKSFYDTNGNPQAGGGLTNVASFQNMQIFYHWLGTVYTPYTNSAWYLGTNNGWQSVDSKDRQLYAMAVRNGDVLAPVPEPETYAMLLAGLGLIGAITRRRQSHKSLATKS